MRRVAIIGNGGGGKSILARELGRALGLPVHAVDDVQWQPGWVRTPLDDMEKAHARWLAEPGWIIDGWGSWEHLAERFAMADAIVFVDFPLRTHYWWALKRQVECTLGLRRDWPPKGCKVLPITWRLLQVIRRVHYEHRPRLIALLAESHIRDRVIHLRSRRELRLFRLSHVGQTYGGHHVRESRALEPRVLMQKQPWFERSFPTSLPAATLPLIIERLRGTPARLIDRVGRLTPAVLTRRLGDTWSIQENVGHLLDLEPLWVQRAEELLAGGPTLAAADLQNRRTHQANHNAVPLGGLLDDFRKARGVTVGRLEGAGEAAASHAAMHPRLGVPMNLVDHAYFVAEHDDYHLARITELLRAFA